MLTLRVLLLTLAVLPTFPSSSACGCSHSRAAAHIGCCPPTCLDLLAFFCPAGEGQQRVLSELEREFNSGLARRNRTTGLGA